VTLLEFVKRECANWKRGTCLFGACSVAAGKRCCVSRAVLLGGDPRTPGLDYFSACVAPLAEKYPQYADAADEYAGICGAKVVARRWCGCGEPLARGKQCCEKCRRKRATDAQRKWRARCREKLAVSAL
jgi:hypothetical protein